MHDGHSLRLRIGLGARDCARILYSLLEQGALRVVHSHVFQHGVEHESITRYALPWLRDELTQTELVPRVGSRGVFDTLGRMRTSRAWFDG